LLAREALLAIANQVFAGYAANFEALKADSKPALTDLRKITLSLKKQLVQPRTNGRYHVIAGPEFYYDMVSDPTVEKYMTINNTTKTMYDDSMLVRLFGMEFYETLACPTNGKFTKIVDGVAKKCIRLVEKTGDTYSYLTITEDDQMTAAAGKKKILSIVDGYVKNSRTGEDASYIPNQKVWDIAAYNAAHDTAYEEFKVQHILIVGKDALTRTGLAGEGQAKMYVKAKGSAGVLDPIDQRQSIGFKINSVGFGSTRLEAVVDYVCVPTQLNLLYEG
jgi:hypothetical protein